MNNLPTSKSSRRRYARAKTIAASAAVVAAAHELAATPSEPEPAPATPRPAAPDPSATPTAHVSGSPQPPSEPLTRESVGKQAAAAITNATPEIVKAVIAQAEKGNYLHAKFLFDFAGITATPEPRSQSSDDSLAAILLRELKILQRTNVTSSYAAPVPDLDPPSVE
jgi:hypothetical protein